jgi:hypothetical protein
MMRSPSASAGRLAMLIMSGSGSCAADLPRRPADRSGPLAGGAGQVVLGVALRANVRPRGDSYLPIALDVVTLRGNLIADVTAFRTPMIFSRFQLPDRLPASSTT